MIAIQLAEELARAISDRNACEAALAEANERLQVAREKFNALPPSELVARCRERLSRLTYE